MTYSIVLIPDTQNLTNSATFIAHYQAAADWIIALPADLVLHLGDVTDTATTTEYDRAEIPMDTIWDAGIPFVASIGNHDYDGGAPAADRSDNTQWNTYFGQAKYTGRAWWDGAFMDSSDSDNFYVRLTLGGRPTLVLSLDFYPATATLTWAEGVIAANPARDVIILTHSYLNDDGTLTVDAAEHGPSAYSLTSSSNGEEMWAAFKQYSNVVAVYNGHHINGGKFVYRRGVADDGHVIGQMFANWQGMNEGGEGRIVVLTVDPDTGWADARVYNAARGGFEDQYDTSLLLVGTVPQTTYWANSDWSANGDWAGVTSVGGGGGNRMGGIGAIRKSPR